MSTTPNNTSTTNSNTINNNININICNQALETITTTSPPTPSLTTPSSHTKETSFHSFTNKQIGNYLLLKPIGKGTFSSVYLSLHIPTHITVAIKILEKSKIQDQTDIERIRREITILKQIHHPHIPTLYETISYKQHLFIVMQYIAGGDLFDYIYNENKLPEQTACMIFKQLISCIDYINKIGICHRDIKPENILLNETKTHITLIDFGLSNYCNDNMKLNSSCGSPCYASPEMISGIPYNGTCSDIWSCGVVLYCMLVGCLPFDDDDIQNLYKKILIGEFVLPSTLSSEAIDLIKRLLTVEPKKRITLRQIKTHKWVNCVKGDDNGYWKGSGSNSNYVDKNMVHLIKEKFFSGNGYENVTEKQIYESVVNNNCDKYSATYKLYIEYKKNENVEHNNNINVGSSNNNTNKKIVCKRKNKSANHKSNNNNNNNRGKSKDNIKSQIHYGNNNNNSKQQQHPQSDMNVFVINNIISNNNTNTQNATLTNKTQKQKTQIQRHFTMSSNVNHSTTTNNSHKTSKQYPFQTTSKTPSPFSKQTQHNNTIHNKNQNASPLAKHAIKPSDAKIIKQNRHITKYFTPVALRTQTTTLTTKDTQSNQIMNNDIKQHRQLSHVNEKKLVKEAPYINICESYNIETKIPNNETNKNVNKENNITNIKLIYSRRINNNSGSSNNNNTNNVNINPTSNNISKLIFKGMNKKNSISKDKSKEKKKKLILQKLSII